ncbi:MAG: hypothetical protein H8D22_09145, partial [Candidatus Cloacimonetes bacterium]|nr:hypothetical protein [Candidatus Cloacimonadota bacterium]
MKKNIIAILTILSFSTIIYANSFDNPKSMALGDAYLTKASGFQAVDWNPANLGLIKNFVTINLFQLNSKVSNNSFSLAYYNDLMGKYLDESDKQDLLDRIPNSGFCIDMNSGFNIPVTSFSVWKLALSVNAHAKASVELSKEYFDIILHGNKLGKVYDFSDNTGEAISYIETRLGYGDLLPISLISSKLEDIPPIYGGISLGYIYGIGYAKISDFKSRFGTSDSLMLIDNDIIAKTAGYNTDDSKASIEDGNPAGIGFRANIGFFSPITKDISVGLAFNNLFGTINWNEDCEEHCMHIYTDTLTIDNWDDSLLVDTTYSIDSFKQSIPFEIHLGGSYKLKKYNFYLDYVQGFGKSILTSKKPKISLGAEYWTFKWLPLRVGMGFGGDEGLHFAFGTGIEFKNFEFNWAIRNHGAILPQSSKG